MSPAPKHAHHEQEALVLDAAAKCIEATSVLDFTMSAISKKACLSMGSIYKHIQSKEDVLLALGYRSQLYFQTVAEQVLALPLPMAARLVAVQLVPGEYCSPYAFGSQLISLLGNEAVLQRASPGWLEKFIASDIAVEALFHRKLMQACETEELIIEPENRAALVEEILTSVWAICEGYDQVLTHRNFRNHQVKSVRLETDSTIIRALQRLLNTYPWQTPLSDDLIEAACGKLTDRGLR